MHLLLFLPRPFPWDGHPLENNLFATQFIIDCVAKIPPYAQLELVPMDPGLKLQV
jgi:hypothetical protein